MLRRQRAPYFDRFEFRRDRIPADELAALHKAAIRGNVEARNRIVGANLPLAGAFVKGHKNRFRAVPFNVLVSACLHGLVEAAGSFDPDVSPYFSIYAYRRMYSHCQTEAAYCGIEYIAPKEWIRSRKAYQTGSGLDESGLAAREAGFARRYHGDPGEDVLAGVPSRGPSGPEREAAEELAADLRRAVGGLAEPYRRALTLRYGLDGDGERTLAAIGRELGFTKQWTQIIVERAVEAVRGSMGVEREARTG